MVCFDQNINLQPKEIDHLSEQITETLNQHGYEKQMILRVRFALEEMLLRIRDHYGAEQVCSLKISRTFHNLSIEVIYSGEPFDPTSDRRDVSEAWSERILEDMGLAPAWNYTRSANRLAFHPSNESNKGIITFLVWIGGGILLGLLGNALPESFRSNASELVLTPVFNAFLGLLGTFTGLMVFFSIICGICGMNETASTGKIGRLMITRFCGLTLLWTGILTGLCMLIYSVCFGIAAEGESQLSIVLSFVYGILPSDPFSPFINGDFRQIVFMALFSGTSLMILGTKADIIRMGAEQLNSLFQLLVKRVCKLLPVFVFITLLRLIWSDSFGMLRGLWKPFLAFLITCFMVVSIKICYSALRFHVSPGVLIRKIKPTFLLGLATSSSAAIFNPTLENCEKKLGIPLKLTRMGLPIGNVMCMPTAAAAFLSLVFYLTELYQVPVDLGWVLKVILMTSVIAIAMPPIPGAFLTCFGILLTQLSIPSEGVVVMGILSTFIDMFCTALTNSYIMLELTSQAKHLGILDEETLRR